ncbi:MAG: hypothetical protein L6301_01255 [Desulfobacteraceae bacterium]|nr:hypothetical protein [Desulfobacteraceae bacterium]
MKAGENHLEPLKPEEVSAIYQPGRSPDMDAWYNAFFIENHLDYFTNPDHASTPEQVRFMVYTKEDERYYPCSDQMFQAIISKNRSAFLQKKYNEVFQRVLALISSQIEDPWEKEFLESLIIIKFKHETQDEIMIPSRVEKRLMGMFLRRTQIEDPYAHEKELRNVRSHNALCSSAFIQAVNKIVQSDLDELRSSQTLTDIKKCVETIELKRLMALAVEKRLWETQEAENFDEEQYKQIFKKPFTGNGVGHFFKFLGISGVEPRDNQNNTKKILWLADESGEVIVDIAIISFLEKMGHKVIIAFKEGSLYTKADFFDTQEDETLKKALENVYLIKDVNLGKNDLISILRSDHNVMIFSDGTRENVNLILASTTFARVFKEVDGVISRGHDQNRRFFDSHFQFTQDVYNISEGPDASVRISFKPIHPEVKKFSYKDLENKADAIISKMKSAKKVGMTVMFYSGIIGSIPGKVEIAKKVMSTFVQHLSEESTETFIINPSHYFEEGMDADDLMYMWEIVQRSGYIDIWRFQTYEDIAMTFKLMDLKIPPEWVGKDATFSTGCTKEMKIALDVLQKHHEMQIIGPSREKFMRRDEYGVGKLYDKRLSDACTI